MKQQDRKGVVDLLVTGYWMEIETVMSYLANSVNLDGVRAEEIKKSLAEDIPQELGHAQALAKRIKEIGGVVPGSSKFSSSQRSLQPPKDTTDVVAVIRGVIDAEDAAIEHYNKIIDASDDAHDYASQDLAIENLRDEEGHRITFVGFLKEYTRD